MQRIGILALATLGLACASWDGDEPSPTVARNSDVVITLAELDDWVKESLLRERTDGGEAQGLEKRGRIRLERLRREADAHPPRVQDKRRLLAGRNGEAEGRAPYGSADHLLRIGR